METENHRAKLKGQLIDANGRIAYIYIQHHTCVFFVSTIQGMIIRTTLSKWVVCSDLSFLSRMYFNEQGRVLTALAFFQLSNII